MAVDPERVLLVTPSDHLIKNDELYVEAVKKAKTIAEQDFLVTFGIKPVYPETGYGYIEIAENYAVRAFLEKPTQNAAETLIKNENIFGIPEFFVLKQRRCLKN